MAVEDELEEPGAACGGQVDAECLVVGPDPTAVFLGADETVLPRTGGLPRVVCEAREIGGIPSTEGLGELARQSGGAVEMIDEQVALTDDRALAVCPHDGSLRRATGMWRRIPGGAM